MTIPPPTIDSWTGECWRYCIIKLLTRLLTQLIILMIHSSRVKS